MSEGSVALALDAAEAVDSKWLKLGIIVAGAAGLGFVVWWFVFRKSDIDPRTGGHYAASVEELVNTPITSPVPILQTPDVHLVYGRSECEDALIQYNGASRSHPALAAQIKADAKAKGCGWAQ